MSAPSPSPAEPPAPSTQDPRLWLSALADGDREALPHAQAQWRDDAEARERWHLYHLVGDVMRSEDLASRPGHDRAFLAKLRTRLASEPVPLAPAPAMSPVRAPSVARRLGWRAPAAVAAGFVVVAGALVLLQPGAVDQGDRVGERVARPGAQALPNGGVQLVDAPAVRGAPGRLIRNGDVIRDPSLDAYFEAHWSARRGSPAVGMGGGSMRRIDLVAPVGTLTAPGASAPASPNAPAPR